MSFAVQPIECPHFGSIEFRKNSLLQALRKHRCYQCDETSELWICMHCLSINCSRYSNCHAIQHYMNRDHPVVFNIKSMSFWCYECNSYVFNDELAVILDIASEDYEVNNILYQPFFKTYDSVGVVDYIKSKNVHNIIVLAGAGMSTSAGIPDFRSPGTGLYFNLQKYHLPYPEAVFDMEYFPSNPAPFYEVMKSMFPGQGYYFPTLCHKFIKLLSDNGMLKKIYTQNIDGLEEVAGIPTEKIVHSHGTFSTAKCLSCGKKFSDTSVFMNEIKQGTIIRCECGGLIKPDIVFFNEALPDEFFNSIQHDFDDCDMLIVIGTALVVYPFADLVNVVPLNCPRVCINREKVGKTMSYDNLGRDVALLGNSDEIAVELANLLGWELK